MSSYDEDLRARLEADPAIQELLAELWPRAARYRYWEAPDGRQFVYTTERMGDGKFASAIYVPKGKGARSGKKAVTRLSPSREVHHATRRGARARAYKLYQQHLAGLK
ncbi:MAG TPA: hypothetical protein VI341_13665 [Actinomycetota bacterium]